MKLIRSLRRPFLKLVSRRHRQLFATHRQWKMDRGELRRFDYPFLNAESVVIDLGGFRGEWADGIFVRYQPMVHVFEPHPKFAQDLKNKYAHNPKYQIHPYALSSRDGEFSLSDSGDGSSARLSSGSVFSCRTVEAGRYLQEIGVDHVDLIKINIEGGEYEILPYLNQIDFLRRVRTLQIQFHYYDEQSVAARQAIRETLQATHVETWCYPFVWEQWDRRDAK